MRIRNGLQIPEELPTSGPCYYRALVGIAETYARRTMTKEQIEASVATLSKGDNPAIGKDWTVARSSDIITDALQRLGIDTSRLSIEVARPGDQNYEQVKKSATASLRNVGTISQPDVPGHWQEGDEKGNFRWDPISGVNGEERTNFPNNTRYVEIDTVPPAVSSTQSAPSSVPSSAAAASVPAAQTTAALPERSVDR
jgi:hypothetical protein